MSVRFSAAARKAIDQAMVDVERRRHATFDTGHLLLGLLEGPSNAMEAALAMLGTSAGDVRERVDAVLRDVHPVESDTVDVASAIEQLLDRAHRLSQAAGASEVTELDILAACAEGGTTVAGRVLAEAGVHVADVLSAAAAAHEAGERARHPFSREATAAAAAGHSPVRVGTGYDSHRFAPGGRLVLGGVEIPSAMGLMGHSDGDAIAHAITDAVLGAAGAGDIGELFPDTDTVNRGRDSIEMLTLAVARLRELGWTVQQVDATVITEQPRIAPHRPAMRARLAAALGVSESCVSVKGKTNEGMGWIGRGEGLACIAVASICRSATTR